MAAPARTARCRTMPQASDSSSGWVAISISLELDVNTGINNKTGSGIVRNMTLLFRHRIIKREIAGTAGRYHSTREMLRTSRAFTSGRTGGLIRVWDDRFRRNAVSPEASPINEYGFC